MHTSTSIKKRTQWLSGEPTAESKCDDALCLTLVVAARGYLDVPSS